MPFDVIDSHEQIQTRPEFSAARSAIVPQLLFILLLGLLDAQMISPLLPAIADDFAVSIAQAGAAVTAYAFAAAICALVIGPLSDRFGRLVFLLAASILMVVAASVCFIAREYELYLAARVLNGVAGGTISACVIAQVADLFSYRHRGRAMGWIGAMYFIVAVIGVPAAAWIASGAGWRALYAGIAIAALVPVWSFGARAGRYSVLFQEPRSGDRSGKWRRAVNDQAHQYWKYLSEPSTRSGLLLALTFSATAAGLLTYLAAWLVSNFGMSLSSIASAFLVAGLASTVGAISGGWLSDRVGKKRMIAWSSLLLAVILPIFAQAQNTTQVYVLFALGGLFMAVREGPYQALITELVPGNQRGAYIALRNSVSQIAIAASAAICGVLYQKLGFGAVTFLLAGLSLGATVFALLVTEPDPSYNQTHHKGHKEHREHRV